MNTWRIVTMVIVLIGGIAVLGSYAHGVVTAPGKASALWGGVPKPLLPAYTASMFLAAAGFLATVYFLVFRVDSEVARFGFGLDFRAVPVLLILILVPSALWMGLTIRMVEAPGAGVWIAIRIVLAVVGLAALGLVVLLLTMQPPVQGWSYWTAVAGSIVFFIHTGILDGLVWPAFFPH